MGNEENKDLERLEDDLQLNEEQVGEFPTDVNKVLQSIEPEKRKVIISAMYAIEKTSSFSGPLPPPEDFKAYKDVLPSAPERILSMAEKQLEHRTEMERKIVASGIYESRAGQIIGCLLALSFLGAAIYLGMHGHDWLAGAIIAIIASVATIFVLKREPQTEKENEILSNTNPQK